MTTNNSINARQSGIQKYDGAGTWSGITVTNHSPLIGAASNGITSLGPLTNGQLVIGSTGNDPVASVLTAGSGIGIVNASGSITISATSGGFIWSTVTGTSQTISAENGYIANNASLITFTLPSTAAVGDTFKIMGLAAGGWTIVENTGQSIIFGDVTSTTTSGSISSTDAHDSITVTCTVANTTWSVSQSIGNLSIV